MKKILSVNETEKQRILEMHGFTKKTKVISEQYAELKGLLTKNRFIEDFITSLEKSNSKSFDEVSTILGRQGDETLTKAFDRVLSKAVQTQGREGGVKILQFCKKLSTINSQFAEEFYKSQIKVIDKIKEKYPGNWETLVKTNYGEKILEKYKKGTSSSSSSSKLDELGIANQIKNYLNPNRFDSLNKQAFEAQFALTKNKLSSTSDIFSNQSLLNDVFGVIFSKNATGAQIEELLNGMSMKIGFNKEQQEVFDKLLNYFSTGKNPSFGKYQTPWLNDIANMGSDAWNGVRPIVEPVVNKLVNKGIKVVKWGLISVSVVVFLLIVLLLAGISALSSSLKGGGSKKERTYKSQYED